MIISIFATIVVLVFSSAAAYGLARFRTRGGREIATWMLTTRVFPPAVVAIPIFLMMNKLHLVDTYLATSTAATPAFAQFRNVLLGDIEAAHWDLYWRLFCAWERALDESEIRARLGRVRAQSHVLADLPSRPGSSRTSRSMSAASATKRSSPGRHPGGVR